nr:NB-ARC domain-containing protein [Streptomyces acidiscabies]
MEAELAGLAASGATALVGLIVSEGFERAKSGLTRFFGRRASGEGAEEELAAAHEELGGAGDTGARAAVQDRLRHRLEEVFQEDSGAAAELARLLSDLAPDASRGYVELVGAGVNHGLVLQGSPVHGNIHFHVPAAPSPAPDRRVRPDQVPALTMPFSNREAELGTLETRLGARAGAAVGVDVLFGPPGVGKSAMAWRCAEKTKAHFPDGQLYVDFAALRDGSAPLPGPGGDVSEALAMCLRSLPGGELGIPDSLHDRTNLFRSRTADLRILLVLDDVDQAAQVRALIPKGPGSAVLATSQRRIGELAVGGSARFVRVETLDTHGGLELLRDRCCREVVEAEPEAAKRLVELCDGLPVALLVVAARLNDECLSMAELAAELDDEAGRLAGLALDGEESVVSTVLGPTYRLLPPEAARLYRLLGLLPVGRFDAGVAAVAAEVTPERAKSLLLVLVKDGLVEKAHDDRYRMHDLIRLHARERAAEEEPATEQTALIERVGTHYLVLCAFADRALRKERLRAADLSHLLRGAADPFATAGGPPPLEWLAAEHTTVLAVLREAVRHELYPLARRLAESFSVLFLYHRYLRTWVEVLELGIEAAEKGEPDEEARATGARLRSLLSRPLLDLGENDRAGEQLERAVALAETTDRLALKASVHEFLGRYLDVVDPPRAADAYRRSLQLNEQAGETRGAALVTFFLGCALDAQGEHAEALTLLRRAHQELTDRAEPDLRMAARAKATIGVVHGRLGDTAQAMHDLREAIGELAGEADGMQYEAQARVRLADIAEEAGGHEELVRECLSRAAAIYEALGDSRREEELRRRLGDFGG